MASARVGATGAKSVELMMAIYLALCLVAVVGYGLFKSPLVLFALAAIAWAYCRLLDGKPNP